MTPNPQIPHTARVTLKALAFSFLGLAASVFAAKENNSVNTANNDMTLNHEAPASGVYSSNQNWAGKGRVESASKYRDNDKGDTIKLWGQVYEKRQGNADSGADYSDSWSDHPAWVQIGLGEVHMRYNNKWYLMQRLDRRSHYAGGDYYEDYRDNSYGTGVTKTVNDLLCVKSGRNANPARWDRNYHYYATWNEPFYKANTERSVVTNKQLIQGFYGCIWAQLIDDNNAAKPGDKKFIMNIGADTWRGSTNYQDVAMGRFKTVQKNKWRPYNFHTWGSNTTGFKNTNPPIVY
jgi:hypothetical protein